MLKRLTADEHEYARRRALLAIRETELEFAESVALSWLGSEHEYARMVALDTLHVLRSEWLAEAVDVLREDLAWIVQNRIEN